MNLGSFLEVGGVRFYCIKYSKVYWVRECGRKIYLRFLKVISSVFFIVNVVIELLEKDELIIGYFFERKEGNIKKGR